MEHINFKGLFWVSSLNIWQSTMEAAIEKILSENIDVDADGKFPGFKFEFLESRRLPLF